MSRLRPVLAVLIGLVVGGLLGLFRRRPAPEVQPGTALTEGRDTSTST